ncbi:MAG TPA: phage tail tube protein [Pelagibacterium sp.]|uniref:phage tail tube protein n=1 Tax=Pelagibacterium sp. TaxID=1967288 RepID=UPI002CE35D32|nr:phage tail tube protein [Pelagibacterium sp.]HWJ89329.1 phage tail tube protein [Pelagibacterium sp.]
MTKPRAVGADAVQLIARESDYGTAPDGVGGGVYARLPMRSYGLSPETSLEEDPTWNRGTPDAGDPVEGPITVSDNMIMPACSRAIGAALALILGSPDTEDNQDDTYTHVFASGQELPSFSIQTGHPKLSVPKWRTVLGVKAGGINFDMSRTGRALLEIPLIGQKQIKDLTGARDATPLQFDYLPFDNITGSITVDGDPLASVTAARFAFSNGLEPVETIRADGVIDGIDEGERTASGSLDARFGIDATLEDLADAKTPCALQFAFALRQYPTRRLVFSLPRVFLSNPKIPITGPGGISQSWQWRAAHDADLGYLLGVTLINDVEAY